MGLHDLWLISQSMPAYTAAEHALGPDIHQINPWIAYQFNRATMFWGRYVDARLEARVERTVERKRNQKPTILVPKYTYREALGLDDRGDHVTPEIEEEARQLLSGELPLKEWLQRET